MIKLGDQFVSKYDGYAVSLKVIATMSRDNVTKSVVVSDGMGAEIRKLVKQRSDGKLFFNHRGHHYALESDSFSETEYNRIKL